jgi:hypothetical protein
VTIAVGIFDLFTYLIPGSLYLTLFGYTATRLDWIDPAAVGRTPLVLLLIAAVLLSYLLGYLAYPLGQTADRLLPRRHPRHPREEFVRRNPAARDRDFVHADLFLLASALQVHDKDIAHTIDRMRATGLMLRNSAPSLALAFPATLLELFLGPSPVLSATAAILLSAGAIALIIQSRRLRHMASLKTLELCFWLPDLDEKLRSDPNGTPPATHA